MQIKRGPKPKKYWANKKMIVEKCKSYDMHIAHYHKYRARADKEGLAFSGTYDAVKKRSVFIVKKMDRQSA